MTARQYIRDNVIQIESLLARIQTSCDDMAQLKDPNWSHAATTTEVFKHLVRTAFALGVATDAEIKKLGSDL